MLERELSRISQISSTGRRVENLAYLLNTDLLRQCFKELDPNKASGIETREAPFAEMADDIRRVYETGYAGRFSEMYSLWREAAYSDHAITEADRTAMDRFTKETVAMVSGKWNTMQRLRMKYKHAL